MKSPEKKTLNDFSNDLKNVNARNYFIGRYLSLYFLISLVPIILFLNFKKIVIFNPNYTFLSRFDWITYLLNKNDGVAYGPAFVSSYSILLLYILLVVIKFIYDFKKPYTSLVGTRSEKLQTVIFRVGSILLAFIYAVTLTPIIGVLLFSAKMKLEFGIGLQALWYILMCIIFSSTIIRILHALNRYPDKIAKKYDLWHFNVELHRIFKEKKMFSLFKSNRK